MESMEKRKEKLMSWLQSKYAQPFTLQDMPKNASFRRYYRVITQEGSMIAMDAPPEFENCTTFVTVSNALREINLTTPEIVQADFVQGFLLLSDFGDLTLLNALNQTNADEYYQLALTTLARMKDCQFLSHMTVFDQAYMLCEWQWHKNWFLSKLLNISLLPYENELDELYEYITKNIAAEPQVFMHRDYHAANLMMLPNRRIGILDFQDAFIGPISYDVASLLRDCYIDWPQNKVNEWMLFYLELLKNENKWQHISFEKFTYDFDLMSIQRHLKALFTFARKTVRDQQPEYLIYIPRVLKYLTEVSARHSSTKLLHDFLLEVVTPAWLKKEQKILCVQ